MNWLCSGCSETATREAGDMSETGEYHEPLAHFGCKLRDWQLTAVLTGLTRWLESPRLTTE